MYLKTRILLHHIKPVYYINLSIQDLIVEKKYNLTILRGITCLLIVNYHMVMLNIPVFKSFVYFSKGGFVFNTAFVALSGYLLMSGAIGKEIGWQWIKKRFLRIYPSFILSLLIICFLTILFALNDTLNAKDLLYLTGFHYFFGLSNLGPHLWFVSVILACYLLFKPNKRIIQKKPVVYFLSLVFIFYLFTLVAYDHEKGIIFNICLINGNIFERISSEIHLRFIYHFIIFSISMFFALHEKGIKKIILSYTYLIIPFLIIMSFFYIFIRGFMPDALILNAIVPLSAFCGVILYWIVITFVSQRLLRFKVFFEFLSKISYEMYLIHFVVILIFKKYNPMGFSYIFALITILILSIIIQKITSSVVRI